ncbi:DUF4142 domain-containing protein [Actinoplanes sp. NBRC 101535]|uniref:DUF4142 domain-containing protein n=1 Tax=Actinoplanes sp. NBRC 101535 TaxID=3032196 RepID=UPI0024A14C9E|nr:DUF4142 domain-containing protein [Actinoplanes sp. NBRC 101535]GLY08623.1 hypothetical protein Acsp01_90020 [Actinoplanes sp. NBRC 101535]
MPLRSAILALAVVAALIAPATTATARPISPDADYLISAHQGNLTQILAGRTAAGKALKPEVRKMGATMATYHAKLDLEVQQTARTLDVKLPAQPNSEQLALIEQYRIAPAAVFDKLYLDTQIPAHDHALKITRILLATGTDPAVRRIAETASPIIQQHRDALAAVTSTIPVTTANPKRHT